MRFATAALFVLLSGSAAGQDLYAPERDPDSPPEISYERYFTRDRFQRRITFYLPRNVSTEQKPLIVFLFGSGFHSNFARRGARILDAHGSIRDVIGGRAWLLVVEKPGVRFLDQAKRAGTALGSSEEFRREHTLERWAEAVTAALRAARSLPFGEGEDAVAALEVLFATLLAKGRDVTAHVVVGADHSFEIAADPARDGPQEQVTQILSWFLK